MSRPPVRRWLRAGALALAIAPIASPFFVVALFFGLTGSDPLHWVPAGILFIYVAGAIPACLGVASYLTVTWLLFDRMRHWPGWKWISLGAGFAPVALFLVNCGFEIVSWYEYSDPLFDDVNWRMSFAVSVVVAMHGATVAALIRWMLMKEPPPPPRPSHLTSKPRASSRTESSSKVLNSSVSPGTK